MKNRSFIKIEKGVLKVLSVIISMTLWVFISYTTNPDTNRTFRNIEINYLYPKEADVVILNEYPKDVDIEFEGKNNDIIPLEKNSIKVYVDLRKTKLGKNNFPLEINSPRKLNLNVVSQEFDSVDLEIDRVVKKTFQVKVRKEESPHEDRWLDIKLQPESVTVSGPNSYVTKIKELYIECDAKYIEKEHSDKFDSKGASRSQIYYPVLMDLYDDNVDKSKLQLDEKYVSLDVKIMNNKYLDLKFAPVSLSEESIQIALQKLSQDRLLFQGPESEIKDMTEVNCIIKAVDEIKSSGVYKLKVKFDLPKSIVPVSDTPVYLILDVIDSQPEKIEEE